MKNIRITLHGNIVDGNETAPSTYEKCGVFYFYEKDF